MLIIQYRKKEARNKRDKAVIWYNKLIVSNEIYKPITMEIRKTEVTSLLTVEERSFDGDSLPEHLKI